MLKEAGLRSPRTQLTNVKIEISVRGRRTEDTVHGPSSVLFHIFDLTVILLMQKQHNGSSIEET